jgi:CRISPR-associated protein (Cas_Cas02710)
MTEENGEAQRTALRNYQTDHLIVLVGTNPLPNYVAAMLLLEPGGKLHLIHTNATAKTADLLRAALPHTNVTLFGTDESDPQAIRQTIEKVLSKAGQATVGLHYTGGTKAMSVHAHAAVTSARDDAVCSYLDARSMRMVIDGDALGKPQVFRRIDLAVPVTVSALAKMHGQTPRRDPVAAPRALSFAQLILETALSKHAKGWFCWVHDCLRIKRSEILRQVPLPVEQFPQLCAAFERLRPDIKTAGQYLPAWLRVIDQRDNADGMEAVAKFVEGEWFEEIVLQHLLDLREEHSLTDPGMTFEIKHPIPPFKPHFEFDVAATRGHQLFAISCTTSEKAELCKHKMFEAYVRARQLGGDEARVALICRYANPSLLEESLDRDFGTAGSKTLRVFGYEHWPNLKEAISDWINETR